MPPQHRQGWRTAQTYCYLRSALVYEGPHSDATHIVAILNRLHDLRSRHHGDRHLHGPLRPTPLSDCPFLRHRGNARCSQAAGDMVCVRRRQRTAGELLLLLFGLMIQCVFRLPVHRPYFRGQSTWSRYAWKNAGRFRVVWSQQPVSVIQIGTPSSDICAIPCSRQP